MNKTEKLEELFRKWAELHKIEDDNEYNTYHKYEKNGTGYIPKQNFYGDGILFEDEYTSAKCKILFIKFISFLTFLRHSGRKRKSKK